MRILLMEDMDKLGTCGDEVVVKDGYARNFLIPQGKAIHATPNNVKQFNHQKNIVQRRLKKLQGEAQTVADQIAAISLTVTKKVGDQGKLFGSVTSQEIAGMLKDKGVGVDRRKINLGDPIKALGDFKIEVKLHPQVTAEIKLSVVAEEKEPAAEPVAEETPAQPAETAVSGEENPETPA